MVTEPMTAYRKTPELDKLKFPYLASRKIDGVRALIDKNTVLSRTLKPIPNAHVQDVLGLPQLQGLDGELVVGDANAPDVFQKTMSGIMSLGGTPNFMYLVFDCWDRPELPFRLRMEIASERVTTVRDVSAGRIPVFFIPHVLVGAPDELVREEARYLEEGYEGAMIRSLHGKYKEGRTTLKEDNLFKIKRFVDGEAVVIGVEEEYENTNMATISETGHSKRSSALGGMVAKGTLGALVVRDLVDGREFKLGSGFTREQRRTLWTEELRGRVVTYKHFPYGAKDAPRLPIFKGFRDKIDIGA